MAKKTKTVYRCTECGENSLRWMGQCPTCQAWNSLEESVIEEKKTEKRPVKTGLVAQPLPEARHADRIQTGLSELDQLLGGGIMPGSLVLLGGEPGVGKSTLLLGIASSGIGVTYISGEESIEQIATRARRLGIQNRKLKVVHESDIEGILNLLEKDDSDLVFIDSIQTMHAGRGFAGSVAQIRDATHALLEFAKSRNKAVVVTGHITKEGQIAGPKQLEHAVDVVLYFENESNSQHRLIRSVKNRFGATGEIALFEMTAKGLRQVTNKGTLLPLDSIGGVGSVLFPQVEGSRVIVIEIQVLVTPTGFANGRRIGENIDASRIHIAAAILEKYLEYRLSQCDIFVKVNGSSGIHDKAAELALVVAMASSYLEKEVPGRLVIAGEVSLTGQVRLPAKLAEREKACQGLGISTAAWGGDEKKAAPTGRNMKRSFFTDLEKLMQHLFGSNK